MKTTLCLCAFAPMNLSSYDFVSFKKEDVEIWLSQAEQFIGKVQEVTTKIIGEDK